MDPKDTRIRIQQGWLTDLQQLVKAKLQLGPESLMVWTQGTKEGHKGFSDQQKVLSQVVVMVTQ